MHIRPKGLYNIFSIIFAEIIKTIFGKANGNEG